MSKKRPRDDCSSSPSSTGESFACQNGCGIVFTIEHNRMKHERNFCPRRDNDTLGTSLASHESLGIPNTECRICGETSSRKDSTKRHERDTHGVLFSTNGSAYLPSFSPSKLLQSRPNVETSVCQGDTPSSAQECDTTLSDVEQPVNNAEFLFTVAIPTTHSLNTLTTIPGVSTAQTSLVTIPIRRTTTTIPGDSMASEATAANGYPVLGGSNTPVSPIIIPIRMITSLANAEPPPAVTLESLRCNSCLKEFGNLQTFRMHRCNLAPNLQTQDDNGNTPLILQPPLNEEETIRLLEKELCVKDIVNLCRLQRWCLKGYWPLVFPGSGSGAPLFELYTAGSKSGFILQQLLQTNQIETLPKMIIIQDELKNVRSLLQESTLRPRGFNFTVGPRDFVVTANVSTTSSENQTQDGSDIEADNSFEDSASLILDSDDSLSQSPSNDSAIPRTQSSSPSSSSNVQSPEEMFESVLPTNMDPGLDDLGETFLAANRSSTPALVTAYDSL